MEDCLTPKHAMLPRFTRGSNPGLRTWLGQLYIGIGFFFYPQDTKITSVHFQFSLQVIRN